MICYAVVDTNVLVSAILSKKSDTATVKVIKAIVDGKIIPLIHETILEEYFDVLRRDKFHLQPSTVERFLQVFRIRGIETVPMKTDEVFIDSDDSIFYEIALAKPNSYLITGNLKHFPIRDFVVSPSQMISIIEKE